jgi:hypothetical protein
LPNWDGAFPGTDFLEKVAVLDKCSEEWLVIEITENEAVQT